jgi:hypothetical protein
MIRSTVQSDASYQATAIHFMQGLSWAEPTLLVSVSEVIHEQETP